jgi:hypothetical protein
MLLKFLPEGKVQASDNYIKQNPRYWGRTLGLTDCWQVVQSSDYTLKVRADYDIQQVTKGRWKNMLILPIVTRYGTYVLQAAGKNLGEDLGFSCFDEELFQMSGQHFVHIANEYSFMQAYHGILDDIPTSFDEIDLSVLTAKVQQLSRAEKGIIYVVDNDAQELYYMSIQGKHVCIPLSMDSFPGSSILKNEVVNIPDAYKDNRFDQSLDAGTNIRTKQLLLVPITGADGQVIGAVQAINSHNDKPFNELDCHLLRAFRVYIQAIMCTDEALRMTSDESPPISPLSGPAKASQTASSAGNIRRSMFMRMASKTSITDMEQEQEMDGSSETEEMVFDDKELALEPTDTGSR